MQLTADSELEYYKHLVTAQDDTTAPVLHVVGAHGGIIMPIMMMTVSEQPREPPSVGFVLKRLAIPLHAQFVDSVGPLLAIALMSEAWIHASDEPPEYPREGVSVVVVTRDGEITGLDAMFNRTPAGVVWGEEQHWDNTPGTDHWSEGPVIDALQLVLTGAPA